MDRCPHCESPVDRTAEACADCGLILSAPIACAIHADRSAHARCAVCGQAICELCASESLRRFTCPRHDSLEIMDGHAVLTGLGNSTEAELLRGRLEAEGIAAWIHDQRDRSYSVGFGNLSPIKVLVPRDRVEEAKQLLEEIETGAVALEAGCPKCGRPLDPDDPNCAVCA